MVVIEVVGHDVYGEWAEHSTIFKAFPVKVLKPFVIFQFRDAFGAKSLRWIDGKTSVNEIGCFAGPVFRDASFCNFYWVVL